MRNFTKGMLMFLSAATTAGLVSCSDDAPWNGSSDQGGINLNFSADARVMRSTRADDSVSPVVPGGESFAVSLVSKDGSFSKKWSSIEGFNREQVFPIGDYSISASYGDINVEGFDNPYYTGSADAHVAPGAVTEAQITATLANAMVSIRYTDDFNTNYPHHSAAVQTAGHEWVVFAQSESRPAYVSPSDEVKLNLTLTNEAGEEVTIQPASFQALPRHHYVVTMGVTGAESGDLKLDVIFDDEVVNETVTVSLNDDLFTAPAPSVKIKGMNEGESVQVYEAAEQKTSYQFDVFAYGGLKSATLNIVADNGYVPGFGSAVNLIGAAPLTQQAITADGVDCAGFFRNVDKMGVVNVSKFLPTLPVGKYKIEIQVVDAMTRTTEPVAMQFEVLPVNVEFTEEQPAATFMGNELTVELATNCPDIKNNVTFKVPDETGKLVPATVKSVSQVSSPAAKRTRADLGTVFRYVLSVGTLKAWGSIDVEATIGKKVRNCTVEIPVPEYTITPDAFAQKVVMKVEAATDEIRNAVIDKIKFFSGENAVADANVSHDANGYITIIGLKGGSDYTGFSADLGGVKKSVPFKTENETTVPNGDFSAVTETINIQKINNGGLYDVTFIGIKGHYQNLSHIVRSTPDDWANLNELTCYSGTSNKNTWYMVPSTYSDNGAVVLESVGYNHAGPEIAESGGSNNTNYYCENSPSDSQLDKAAGEIFLGSYTNQTRSEGISFTSRPSSVTFDYQYTPLNNEQAEMWVKVFDASGAVIAQNTVYLNEQGSMTTYTVALPAYPFGKKAVKLVVGFKSTKTGVTPAINIPTGNALKETTTNFRSESGRTCAANTYHAVAKGSQLRIDNVKLGYEASAAANASYKPRKSSKRR